MYALACAGQFEPAVPTLAKSFCGEDLRSSLQVISRRRKATFAAATPARTDHTRLANMEELGSHTPPSGKTWTYTTKSPPQGALFGQEPGAPQPSSPELLSVLSPDRPGSALGLPRTPDKNEDRVRGLANASGPPPWAPCSLLVELSGCAGAAPEVPMCRTKTPRVPFSPDQVATAQKEKREEMKRRQHAL